MSFLAITWAIIGAFPLARLLMIRLASIPFSTPAFAISMVSKTIFRLEHPFHQLVKRIGPGIRLVIPHVQRGQKPNQTFISHIGGSAIIFDKLFSQRREPGSIERELARRHVLPKPQTPDPGGRGRSGVRGGTGSLWPKNLSTACANSFTGT
jgi:hypothetical protein